jgi:hypothetical protein
VEEVKMRESEGNLYVLDILSVFSHFLNKAEYYPYIPGNLRMNINIFRGKTFWSIYKNPNIDILKPYRMFFGTARGIYKDKMLVMDQENTIDDLIEGIYKIKLDKTLENTLIEIWGSPQKLTILKETNPNLYEIMRKRISAIKNASEKHHIKIRDRIDKELKHVWMEIEIDTTLIDDKETVNKIYNSIEILREIYKDLFECDDDEQKYPEHKKTHLINQLRIHVSTLHEIVSLFKDKVIWDHIGLSESPGFTGSRIMLSLKTKNNTQMKFYISRKTREAKPNKYNIRTQIEGPNELIIHMQNKIKPVKRRENQLYYENTDLTLPQTLEEIKNIIQTTTEQ